MKHFFFALLILISPLFGTAQGAWVHAPKGGFAQFNATFIPPYSSIYTPDGSLNVPRDVTDVTLQFYGEYGLFGKTNLIANLPFKVVSSGEEFDNSLSLPDFGNGSQIGLGNAQLGLRQGLLTNKVHIAAQMMVDLPTPSNDDSLGLRTGLDAWTFTPGIGIGGGFGGAYAQLGLSTPLRTDGFSHSFNANFEIGYKFFKIWTLAAVFNSQVSFQNQPDTDFSASSLTSLYVNNQEYLAYGLKTFVELPGGFGLSGAFYGAFDGSYVAQSPSINFGAFYKWSGGE